MTEAINHQSSSCDRADVSTTTRHAVERSLTALLPSALLAVHTVPKAQSSGLTDASELHQCCSKSTTNAYSVRKQSSVL